MFYVESTYKVDYVMCAVHLLIALLNVAQCKPLQTMQTFFFSPETIHVTL